MKLIIDHFEVEVKAKFEGCGERYNKEATLFLLNRLAMLASEAKTSYEINGVNSLANNAQLVHDQLYRFCEENGAYK